MPKHSAQSEAVLLTSASCTQQMASTCSSGCVTVITRSCYLGDRDCAYGQPMSSFRVSFFTNTLRHLNTVIQYLWCTLVWISPKPQSCNWSDWLDWSYSDKKEFLLRWTIFYIHYFFSWEGECADYILLGSSYQ